MRLKLNVKNRPTNSVFCEESPKQFPVARKQVTVTVTVTRTAGVKKSLLGLDSWIAAAEEVSLQPASEGGKRRCCRRDVLRQTVPNTGCSDWKGPVADG